MWPYSYRFPSFLPFAKAMQCTEYSKIWLNLTFEALSQTFIRGHKAFPVFHADRVIIGLPWGQGQLSRIWKVQCNWLSLGKEYCARFVGREEIRAPLKTPEWEASPKLSGIVWTQPKSCRSVTIRDRPVMYCITKHLVITSSHKNTRKVNPFTEKKKKMKHLKLIRTKNLPSSK